MKWRRIIRLAILLSFAAAAAVGGLPLAYRVESWLQQRAQRPNPVIATPYETQAIFVAVLAKADFVGIPPPPPKPGETLSLPKRTLLLESTSTALSWQVEGIRAMELDHFAPRKMREELLLANRSPRLIPNPNVRGVRFVATPAIEAIFRNGSWAAFYQTFPGTAGFAGISIPVLSKDRQKALVYFEQHCDGVCGSGSLHLLVRTQGSWKDIGQELLWIS